MPARLDTLRYDGVDAGCRRMPCLVDRPRLYEHLRPGRVCLGDEWRGVAPEQHQDRYSPRNRGFDSLAVVFATFLVGLSCVVVVGDDDVLAKGSIRQQPDLIDAPANLSGRAPTKHAAAS